MLTELPETEQARHGAPGWPSRKIPRRGNVKQPAERQSPKSEVSEQTGNYKRESETAENRQRREQRNEQAEAKGEKKGAFRERKVVDSTV